MSGWEKSHKKKHHSKKVICRVRKVVTRKTSQQKSHMSDREKSQKKTSQQKSHNFLKKNIQCLQRKNGKFL